MDRAYVERLLANAKTRSTTQVHLPKCGQELRLFTSLTHDEQLRVGVAGGSDEDSNARFLTGILRFTLIDADCQLLLRSFGETAAFVNALEPEDLGVLFDKLQELAADLGDGEGDGGVEAGKAS